MSISTNSGSDSGQDLIRLEDPTASHVMAEQRPAAPSSQLLSSSSVTTSSAALMLPPKPRPKKKKIILAEEDYVGALETIIERDFFPDAATTAHHMSLLDALEKKDFHSIEMIRRKILDEQVSSADSTDLPWNVLMCNSHIFYTAVCTCRENLVPPHLRL